MARNGTVVERVSASPEETEQIAAGLVRGLRAGDVVTVAGELGAGKTTFVRGAARALGVTAPVTSPTFTIGNRYAGSVDVSHLDLYRFSSVAPAEWGDLEPYFEHAVCFVEWPERGGAVLASPRVAVRLRHLGADRRLVELASEDASLLARIAEHADARV